MSTRGNLYQKLIGGQNLNVADLLLENFGNAGKPVERIIVDCDTTNGLPIAITLPQVSDLGPATNFELLVKDSGGNAAVQNITVTRGGLTDTINNATNAVINTAHGAALFIVSTVKTGASGWTVFNLSQLTPTPPVFDKNEQALLNGANQFLTVNKPILNTRHVIVADGTGRILTVGTNYNIDYVNGIITALAPLAPGDPLNVFYSHN